MSLLNTPRRITEKLLRWYFILREPVHLARGADPGSPPLFIVGPPRSGTTLVYQAITTCLRTSFFCNFAAWHPTTPVAATKFARTAALNYRSNYRSDYGQVPGRGSAAEAQQVWKQWFGRDHSDGSSLSQAERKKISASITAIQSLLDGPFFAKDISNSLRVRALDAIFPGCLFIRISRDPLAIAKSILKARHEYRKKRGFAMTDDPKNEWIFINSKDFEQFYNQPYLQQIASQIFHTENILEKDLGTLPESRCLRIEYESFCADPRREIQKLRDFAANHDIRLQDKSAVPESFSRPPRQELLTPEQQQERNELRTVIDSTYASSPLAES